MAFDANMFGGGLGGFLGGLFGDSGAPYDKAMDQYKDWANKAQNVQNPFLNAGTGAIGDYQKWLQGMQDPSQFMNKLMGGYQESPYAHNLQQQAMRVAQNMGSASGLSGSTPLMQQMQQNAGNIASGDQQSWLQNVLGVNRDYGQGQQNMMNMGQNSANTLTDLYKQMAGMMGKGAFGQEAGKQNDMWNMIGGGLNMFGSLFM